MSYLFDPSAIAFHAVELATAPAGSIPVSAERHAELMAAQAAGQRIVAGGGGVPTAVDPPPPPAARLQIAARRRIGELATQALAHFSDGVPSAELVYWLEKATAATAYAGGSPSTAERDLIEIEAAETGEDPAALAQTIVTREATLRAALPKITGVRRRHVAVAVTIQTLEDYTACLEAAELAFDAALSLAPEA
ncbi:MAG: hypothetical protein AAF192_20150 [Pseudomonadota bacterium]